MRSYFSTVLCLAASLFNASEARAPPGELRQCLLRAVDNNRWLVAFEGELLYRERAAKYKNLNWPVTPAAVTFPETKEQVAAVVKCAADLGYKVQAKSGGHSYGNYGFGGEDGAIIVDLKHFKHFYMDYSTYQATLGAGMLLEEVKDQLHNAGNRAIAHGTTGRIGLGGHATIGGMGPTARQWGTTLDHILEVEVVLANSSIVRASETQNPDLFFAIRGAGPSFGIVTEFIVRTQEELVEAVQYRYTFGLGDPKSRANLFKNWQQLLSDPQLSRKFHTICVILEDVLILSGTFFGSKAEYDSLGIDARFPGSSNSTTIVLKDWLAVMAHAVEDEIWNLTGYLYVSFYAKSMSFTEKTLIPADGIDKMFQYLSTKESGAKRWVLFLDLEGGAINDVPADRTAYPHRDVLFWLQTYAIGHGKVSQTTYDFVDGLHRGIAESITDFGNAGYAGYIDPRLENAQEVYWAPNLRRLERIKGVLDPGDVFHNPQGVVPAM